jgi:TatD DNase family protein
MVNHKKVIAIGEIGLDYYWSKDYVDLQKEMFIKQINIAKEYNLPIIVHSRSASNDTYTILKENMTKGVLHCYSQSLEMAYEYVKLGYYLGIGGVLTFKNSKEIKEVVEMIDLKHLVIETDGPYLAPTPYRGKLNKPAYLKYVIEEIARIKNLSVDDVKKSLENSTNLLFGI